MKFFLISLVILIVMFVSTKFAVGSMDTIEWLTVKLRGHYPKRVLVCSGLTVLSFIETVISLIVWIINM